ncbi:activity-dependent neuroprotector homeobox protein 2-like [Mesocricetus auratus]|uniref:Activity-dependent neuroprotector homeobox protein 2-like n=1 Tax=Mesocricetus auratus TaxID=10036 RepID=A0A3Q0CLM8_MESAU|nr:activity-dependent neuroprotector homeobox protein 2-like [Mesocricetus auratus]
MFQVPVENLDDIRTMRPWVKSVLLKVGFDSCKESLEDLKGFGPGDRYFYNTSWPDVAARALFKNKIRYRSKPYCCSLCRYSADVLSSLRNHLHRFHEDEADQELQIQCPDCSFASRPDVVSRHFSLFHESAGKVDSPKEKVLGNGKSLKGYIKHFTCLKCNFSNTFFYSMKKHVLITHFQSLLNAYIGFQAKEEQQQLKASDTLSVANTLPPERYYCKKCSISMCSQDDLMSHILTSDVHKDLENKLRSVISEHNKRTGLLKQMPIASKPQACLSMPPNSSALHTTAPAKPLWSHLALSPNTPSPAMVQSVTLAQPVTSAHVQPPMGAPCTSWSLTHSLSAAAQSHVTFISSHPSVSQTNLTLQPSAPSSAFYSGLASPNKPIDPRALPVSQPLGPVNKSVGMSNLPTSQAIQPGILPLTQPMGSASRPAGPLVRSVRPKSRLVEPKSRQIRPGTLSSGLSVSPGVLQTTSPGTISVGQVASLAVLPEGQMTLASVIPAQTAASGVLPTGQAVQSWVLNVGQAISSQVLPSCQPVSFRVLPADQVVSSGLLSPKQLVVSDVSVNQGMSSGVPLLGQPVTSGVLPAAPSVRPSVLQPCQSVSTSLLPVNQSVRADTSHNTMFLKSGSVFREILPTGTQVNGRSIYMLDPVPIPQSASLVTATLSQVPNQFMSPSVSPQMSSALPSLSSSQRLVNTADQNIFVQVSSEVDMNMVVRQTKQWKTCPVCKVVFPSNVYQAHMEVAHKQSESSSSEKLEPVKLAVYAPFLKWTREKTMSCLSCTCLVVLEKELMHHLLTHGLGCLFCPGTFHNIQSLLEHSRIKHCERKKLSLDYSNMDLQLSLDANGDLLFPYLDFIITLPREKIGEQEVCLAILSGISSTPLVPLYVKVRPQVKVVPKLLSEQELTCPLCLSTFMISDAYILHLKDRHHIVPVAYTVLRSPAFRCVHCCGVYPGCLTVAAITLHLLHCEHAPKENNSDLQVGPSFVESSELQFVSGKRITDSTHPVKRKWQDGTEDQKRDEKVPLFVLKGDEASDPEEGTSVMPLKRQRNESTTNGLVTSDDLLQILALDPPKYKDYSHEKKKQFLREYFHKKPYPSRKEVELLSLYLKMERINVALFFGTRRYICLKAIEVHRPSVLLGFDMSELKNVKHRLNFQCEPQNSA